MNTSKWGLCCVVVAASISSGYAQQRAATWPGIPIGYESNARGALGGGKGSPSCHSESGDAACELVSLPVSFIDFLNMLL